MSLQAWRLIPVPDQLDVSLRRCWCCAPVPRAATHTHTHTSYHSPCTEWFSFMFSSLPLNRRTPRSHTFLSSSGSSNSSTSSLPTTKSVGLASAASLSAAFHGATRAAALGAFRTHTFQACWSFPDENEDAFSGVFITMT